MLYIMKKTYFLLALIWAFQFSTFAQDAQPQLLTLPEDWTFEFIPFPPDFAPGLKYNGYEELRFAPEMFKPDESRYFTYLFAIELDGKHEFDIPETKQFLARYFRGLSSSVAQSRETTVDTSKITVEVEKARVKTGIHDAYFIKVNFVDSFTIGQEVLLNIELVVLHAKSDNNTYLVALISPQPKYSEVWKEMYTYRKALMQGNPTLKQAVGR